MHPLSRPLITLLFLVPALSGCVNTHTERIAIQGPWHAPGTWDGFIVPEGWHVYEGNRTDVARVESVCIRHSPDHGWSRVCARGESISYSGVGRKYVDSVPARPSLEQVEQLLSVISYPTDLDARALREGMVDGQWSVQKVPGLEIDPALLPDPPEGKLTDEQVDCWRCNELEPFATWRFSGGEFPLEYHGSWSHLSLVRNETYPSRTDIPFVLRFHVDARDMVQVEVAHERPGGTLSRAEFREAAAVILREVGVEGEPEGMLKCDESSFCRTFLSGDNFEGDMESLRP